MEALIRIIAIIIEVLLLAAIAYAVLNGVRLAALDLGIRAKYGRAVTLALFAVGLIVLVFFIAHLTTFYPEGW
jgi:succinate dehydrogenase/fumarate reductase cytochrome b subunit